MNKFIAYQDGNLWMITCLSWIERKFCQTREGISTNCDGCIIYSEKNGAVWNERFVKKIDNLILLFQEKEQ